MREPLTHPQKRARFRKQGRRALAGPLAVDRATDHGLALSVGGTTVEDFAEAVFVDVAHRLLEEGAKINVTVREDTHGPEPNVAIAQAASEVEVPDIVLVRRMAEICEKLFKEVLGADDGVAGGLEALQLAEDLRQ